MTGGAVRLAFLNGQKEIKKLAANLEKKERITESDGEKEKNRKREKRRNCIFFCSFFLSFGR